MLSVIIPVYNVGAYVDKCIESVVKQTYKDLEIIVINDGSTDDSSIKCAKWASEDERIIYIDKQNEGSGKTRNLGIKKATGDFITFLDADDWWREDYAELMMQYMPQCDIAVCDMNYIDCDKYGNETHHISKIRMPDRNILKVSEDKDYINKARTFLCGKVFRKNLFIDNKIEQPTMAINDIPITTLLVAKASYICRVGEPLYNYLRTREGNTITSIKALKSFGDALSVMRNNFIEHKLLNDYEQSLRKMYYSQYRFAIRKAILQKKEGNLSEQEFENVNSYLEEIVYDFWKECPPVKDMYFLKSEDEDINKAISFFVLDDDKIIEDERENTYIVRWGKEKGCLNNERNKVIYLTKKEELSGEDLWWDMADQILFGL